jgi:Tol biopolymer transport system component
VTGTVLGPYRILEKLGEGGMGEVYRAHDTRLDRDVAIKVLQTSVASDADRLHRFAQEARAASALNHPNILTVHDVGTHERAPYLVTELLEGKDLRTLMNDGSLSEQRAVDLALQIASALAAAHEKGIVHRDLKPENVFVTSDHRVKILDFGLAKLGMATSGLLTADAATRGPITAPGVVMGTVGYMSPEQVRGLEADQRSDIFSFGVILYELLSGHRAFARDTAAETLTAVLKEEPPDLTDASRAIHPALDGIVRRCLEKAPSARFQSAHDLGFSLRTLQALSGTKFGAPEPATVQPTTPVSPVGSRSRERALWAAACLLLVLATFAIMRARSGPGPVASAPLLRLALQPPKVAGVGTLAVSPDGQWLAFTATTGARTQLWVRGLAEGTARVVPNTDGANLPFWSPDSRFIGFFAGGQLRKVDVAGGAPVTLADVGVSTGGTWNRDGLILFGSLGGAGLSSVPAAGGTVVPVMRPEIDRGVSDYVNPAFLPDGRHFLFNVFSGQRDSRGVFLASLDAPDRRRILDEQTNAIHVATGVGTGGHLLFGREGALMAQPFNLDTRELTGEAVVIADSVGTNSDGTATTNSFRFNFSASSTGILAFDDTPARQRSQLIWSDRDGGNRRPVDGMIDVSMARLSPDGRRLAVARYVVASGNSDIWVADADGRSATRLTFDPGNDIFPVWSPDGRRLVWSSNRDGVYHIFGKAADGSGQDTPIVTTPFFKFPSDWSRDGRYLIFRGIDPKTRYDAWMFPLEGRDPTALKALQSEANEGAPALSPSGRWLAYASDESGRYEIYVQRFPDGGGKRQVSAAGALAPLWSADGRELFFHALNGTLMSVPVSDSESFSIGAPVPLFEFRAAGTLMTPYYSVTPDGKRFLLSATVEVDGSAPLTIVVNWTHLLRSPR